MVLSPYAPSYDGTNFILVMFPAIISSVYGYLPFPLWSGFEGSPLIYGNQPAGPRLLAVCVLSYYPNVSLRWLSDGLVHHSPVFYSFRCIHFSFWVLLTLKNSQPVFFSFWLPRVSVHLARIKSSLFVLLRFKVLRSLTWRIFIPYMSEPPKVI